MEFLKVISTDRAKVLIYENFEHYKTKVETVSILQATDRILSEDISSDLDVPDFDRSTVDGYAVKSKYTFGSSDSLPSLLDYRGSVNMGEKTDICIDSTQTSYVPTGGMIPEGADAVVMIEYAEKLDQQTIAVNKAVRPGENVTYKGDDIKREEIVFRRGAKLKPEDIGVLAALSIDRVNVYTKPKVYIISTGDEIIDIKEQSDTCKIRDVNGYALYALAEKSGCEVINKVIINDDFNKLKDTINQGADESDIILMSGGSSVGTKDYTYDIINSFGGKGVFINGLSIKPGKPTIVGEVKGKAVFGLPGHPVSAITVYKVLVQYLIDLMTDHTGQNITIEAVAETNMHSSPGKETYQLVDIIMKDNTRTAVPIYGKSGLITTLTKSKGYIVIPENIEGIYKGEKVEIHI